MIKISKDEGLEIKGKLTQVEAEFVLILKEIYKKNVELHGEQIAGRIIGNLIISAIAVDFDNLNGGNDIL